MLSRLPLPYRLPLIDLAITGSAALRGLNGPVPEVPVVPGPLVVSGFFGEPLGIGRAGEMTAEALERAGLPVMRRPLRPALSRFKRLGQVDLDAPPGGVWLIHANAPETLVALMTHPRPDWQGRRRIGFWVWETPEAPAGWTRAARWMDEIWTPSAYAASALAAAFARGGRPDQAAKLRVMPHPVRAPADVAPDRARFGLTPDEIAVLAMVDARSALARKNPWAVIEAWTRAFAQPHPRARLLLRATHLSADPGAEARLKALVAARPDIRLETAALDGPGVWSLMASIDLVISLHRAEGFGLVPAEAMTLGKPVIATDGSATAEFITAETGMPVQARPVPIADASGRYGRQLWFEPDVGAAAQALRTLVDAPDLRARLGAAAQARAAAFSGAWEADAPAIAALKPWLAGEAAGRGAP